MNFFETVAGQRFTQYTLPELVRQLERLNDNLEKLNKKTNEENQSSDDVTD